MEYEFAEIISQIIKATDHTRKCIEAGSISEASEAEVNLLIDSIELLAQYPAIIAAASES